MIYVGKYKPFSGKYENYLELFNEYIVGVCTIIMVSFTQFVKDPFSKFYAGWMSVLYFLLLIFVNVIGIVLTSCLSFNKFRKQKYKKFKNK